jgi:hypothetical protein
MSEAPEKGVCDYAKRHRVITHTSGNELQGPAVTFGCYDSNGEARQALADAGFTDTKWSWRKGYTTAYIAPFVEYTNCRATPTLSAAMELPEVRALRDAGRNYHAAIQAFDGSEGDLMPKISAVNAASIALLTALAPFTEAKP